MYTVERILALAPDATSTSRDATRGVQPEVLPVGNLERQMVVILVATTDEHFEAIDVHGAVRSAFARHPLKT
jgi:hypothetical protein